MMPSIRINTADGKNTWATQYNRNDKLQDRIDYVDATVSVNNCETEYQMSDVAAEVKVRGNYTLEYAKKPIRIKFNKKNNMLGLHEGEKYKNWVLLADWKDLSMSNNTVAFYLGKTILGSDGYYCTDFRNVEVYLNGQYWGVYLLVEQQEVKDGRTSVPEVEDDYTGTDIGYFFEYDGYYTDEQNMPNGAGDPTFVMNYGGGRNGHKGYTVKSDIYDDGQLTFLRNYMDNVYQIVDRANRQNSYYKFNAERTAIVPAPEFTSAKEAVSAVLDVQSLVDTYILNEIACDLDIDWSSFYLSLNMTAEGNKKVTFEAPWDFDSCFGIVNGVCNNAQGMYAMNKGNPWFNLMRNVSWFNDMVCEKWAEIKEYKVLDNALALVAKEKATYKAYYTKNYQKWTQRLNGNMEVVSQLNSYRDANTAQGLASDYLTNWLTRRFAYLDSQWVKIEINEDLPANAVAYKLEAESATFGGGLTNAAIRTNRAYASGTAYVGDLNVNTTLTFTVNVEKATTAYLFAAVSQRANMSVDFGSWFSVAVNGTALVMPYREVPALPNGGDDWHTFMSIKLVPIELKAGANTITFTTLERVTNFDYIEIYSAEKIS
ncbi:MAG: CotH kinase family protein [Clostridia bacterium]|nr:CotH kinase family protein [Clostridia bacterium]